MSVFTEKVQAIVRKIPAGKVLSYSAVAKKAGYPKAHRAVAAVMSKNYDPTIPCHRVICANGTLGGYNRGGPERKRELLKHEGVIL